LIGCHHGIEHTFESQSGSPGPGGPSDRLASLTADVDELASEDLNTLTDVALVEEALELRRLVDRLEGQWLQRLAAIDAWGAAGAEQGIQAPSTASWLRNRLQMGASAATSGPDRPGLVPGSFDWHRRRPYGRGDLGGACQRADPWHQ
jgi:hypothetical protein